MLSINCAGRLLVFDKPKVMGILNITPDSFYENSRKTDLSSILQQAEKMLEEGAAILDIGAQSTRPNSTLLSATEEWDRLQQPLEALVKHFPEAVFSIDTFHAELAEKSIDAGAHIINDVSGGTMDANMFATVAKLQVPYVLMHLRGTPQTMQQFTDYKDVVIEVIDDLEKKIHQLRSLAVHDVIIDVGFGFAKNIEQNYELLKRLNELQLLGLPILAGISRKSMVYKPLGTSAEHALIGTSALHMVALQQGANLLRVHDVKEAVEVVKLWDLTKNQ